MTLVGKQHNSISSLTNRPLKVLQFICPAGFYGAEMWILALAKNLDQSAVECHLAVTRESETQNLEVLRRFEGLGLQGHQIRMRGRFDPRAIRALSRLLREQHFDVIHTHGYKSDLIGLIAGRMAGVKTVATPHGFENAKNLKLQMFIRLGCLALKHFHRVAPLSDDLLKDMRRIGVPPGRVKLIMNGVDLQEVEDEKASTAPLLYRHTSDRLIGYVGQIAHRKNVVAMVRAFDRLHAEMPNTRLLLVGDGAQRAELQTLAGGLASAGNIEFLGYRNDRLRLVKELDIFTMTSSLEGIPRCMMEAMALGRPVAAFNIPGVDKLVLPEHTGLLAPFGDEEGLKNCWKRLLTDASLAERLAKNGQHHVTTHFSALRMAREYTDLFRELVWSEDGK